MIHDIIYHNPEGIIRELIQKIRNREIVFFVGSAICSRRPSSLPRVSKIKEYTIRALCNQDQKEYFDLIYSDISLKKKIESIRFEEFLEIIYRTIIDGKITIRILNCLKEGEPNQNHFFLAEGLGKYFDTILTTNQDPLIERALKKCSSRLLRETQQGDKIFENGRVIKFHGCVEKQDSIITLLRQLVRGLPKNRNKTLTTILKNKSLLFTGYIGQDEDIFRILIATDWKRIYWNVRPGSDLSENIKKLYQKFPDKFFLFEYDLDNFFDKLMSELKIVRFELDETPYLDFQQIFDEWATLLGSQRFNVLGRILGNDRFVKYEEALKCYSRTLSVVSDQLESDKRILARTYHLIGDTFMNFKTFEIHNNYAMAYKNYQKAANCYSKLGDVEAEAGSLVGIGDSCRHQAKYKEAIDSFEKVIQKLIDKKDEEWCFSGDAMRHLGDVHRMQDKYEEAISEYQKAHDLSKRQGLIADAIYPWVWLGEVYVYKGNYNKASRYNSQARRVSRKYHFEQHFAWAKYVEAEINKFKGTGKMKNLNENREEELDKVVEDLNEVFKNLNNRLGQAWCNQMLAELYRLKCDYNESKKRNTKALEFCGKDEVDYSVCLAYIGVNEGETLRAQCRYDAAIKKFEQVLNTKIGDLQRHHAHALLGIAETNRMKGEGNQADYKKALELYRNIGMRHGIVHSLIGLSLFTGIRNKNPLLILNQVKDEIFKKPVLKKEMIFIENLKSDFSKNKKDVFSCLHPLEFP